MSNVKQCQALVVLVQPVLLCMHLVQSGSKKQVHPYVSKFIHSNPGYIAGQASHGL
jgi:hypothetical protein